MSGVWRSLYLVITEKEHPTTASSVDEYRVDHGAAYESVWRGRGPPWLGLTAVGWITARGFIVIHRRVPCPLLKRNLFNHMQLQISIKLVLELLVVHAVGR